MQLSAANERLHQVDVCLLVAWPHILLIRAVCSCSIDCGVAPTNREFIERYELMSASD